MLHRFWKFCNKRKWFNLANALAYYHASSVEWKMLPFFKPPGLNNNKLKSFVNGYLTNLYPLGWISEIENPFVDSDSDFKRWDIKFDFVGAETEVTLRAR